MVWHVGHHHSHVFFCCCFGLFFLSLMNAFAFFFLAHSSHGAHLGRTMPWWLNYSSTRLKGKLSLTPLKMLLKVLTKENIKFCHLSNGGGQRTKQPSQCGTWQESHKMPLQVWGVKHFCKSLGLALLKTDTQCGSLFYSNRVLTRPKTSHQHNYHLVYTY